MTKETKETMIPSSQEFVIPIDLLKTFKNDIRIFPPDPHPNGYITFDRDMLISVLEHGKDVERMELANSLKKMGDLGGELVIMQQQRSQL
ncbi:MAG TPA: hypothetical protein HA261_02240 [Methanosarcina sp.]|nr:hypothetical protein [Methanosarcina sp.]